MGFEVVDVNSVNVPQVGSITEGSQWIVLHTAAGVFKIRPEDLVGEIGALVQYLTDLTVSSSVNTNALTYIDAIKTRVTNLENVINAAADGDAIVNTYTEILAAMSSFPEGVSILAEFQNRYTKTESDTKFLTAIKTGGAYYQQNKILLQNGNEIVKIPQMNKVYLFENGGATSVAMNLAWAIANNLHTEDIFIFENRRTTGDVTITADGSEVYFYIDGTDQVITLKPKQAAMLYRWSTTAYLGYSVFLNKETSSGGGIPEPTGANVPYGRLINGTWTEVMAKPVETTINQNSAITISDFTTQEKATNGFTKTWKIVGDSVNTLTLPTTWLQKNTLLFDNTIVNYIVAEVVNGAVLYEIHNTNVNGTDTQAPQTLGVTTTTDGQKILVTFDEVVQGTSNFTYSSGTIASQTLIGNVAELIPSPPLLSGTTLGTLSGGGTISDLNGNFITPFSNREIDNILAANVASLQGSTQVQGTASKLQLATGAGGTDSPLTLSMWVFVSASTSQKIVVAFSHLYLWIDQNRRAGVTMYNGAIYIAKQTSGVLTLGWNYITVTVDSSKSAAGINIYVNNILSNGSIGSSGTYTGGQVSSYIGIGGATIEHLIDEVVIWNQVLSTANRNNTYNSGQVVDMRSRGLYVANPNNMLFYCKFDNNITDLSPNPVTITGTPTYNTSRP